MKPVPFVPRPIHVRGPNVWRPWLIKDQRFVSGRTDVLEYETAPLARAVHIMGAPQVDLLPPPQGRIPTSS